MKWFSGIGIFLFMLASCTLDAGQEQAFNTQKARYINALNEGSVLESVALTNPCYVAYARSKGPEFFKNTFSDRSADRQLGSQVIRRTVKKGSRIHILFEAEVQYSDGRLAKQEYAAVSSDNGTTWFFMTYADYNDRSVCKDQERLLLK